MPEPLTRRVFVAGMAVFASSAGSRPVWPQPIAKPGSDGFVLLRAGEAMGPTLRVRRGDELRVRLINDSNRPAAIHWHGCRIANAIDGAPGLTRPPVMPGASLDYRFRSNDAGTFWYQPALSLAGERFAGPSGALVVTETERVAVDQDLLFFLAAGAPVAAPTIKVASNDRLRLRLVNATSEPLTLRLERQRLVVVALDGQPAEPLSTRDGRLGLGPGNRADVMVDVALAADERAELTIEGVAPRLIATLVGDYAGTRHGPWAEPGPLPGNPLPHHMNLAAALRIALPLPGSRTATPDRDTPAPLFAVKRGRAVVLAMTNSGDASIPVHIHGHVFRLLDRLDDGWKPFWLDTITVAPSETTRVALIADNPGRWLIEAGAAAVAWFEVTD